jgi:hypothetical protein
MTAREREQVIAAAKATAILYVDEFGVPLDPAADDWDYEAWADDRRLISWFDAEPEDAWPTYQAALITETKRLCADSAEDEDEDEGECIMDCDGNIYDIYDGEAIPHD